MCSFESFSIPEIVSESVRSAPDRAAVLKDGEVLSYHSLNNQANQVAGYLRSIGAGPEDKIGIFIGKSIEFVVAALGILKAGAAYVPLDPSYPEARRQFIIQDAGLKTVLTANGYEAHNSSSVSLVTLDELVNHHELSPDPLPATWKPGQLAYVIYTSGSTGTPKGIQVTHGNLQHLIRWHNQAFQVTFADRAVPIANVGFDAAVWEMWPYLCAGATLCLPAPSAVREPETLRDWLVESEATILFAPTLLAEAFLDLSWPQTTKLRYLLTGGDTLHTFPPPGLPFRLINNYGPAECTVVSTSGEILPNTTLCHTLPSIGRPIPGVQVYLLDDELREVPDGEAGELCIGGEGVARGYLNRPDLNAQCFVAHGKTGTPLHRSGDLACRDARGMLHFLGRIDQQVKIRGYRMECGEIEAALNSAPGVKTSAVVTRQHEAGHPILIAYLVPRDGTLLSRDVLRTHLRASLPEYMLPQQFVRLCEMPVNHSGKIDRQSLPSATDDTLVGDADLPSNPTETALMEIIGRLLKVDQIGRTDDFFLLGGHSFIAAQLIARIRDRFGVELSLRTVFETPTLAGMARLIEQRRSMAL